MVTVLRSYPLLNLSIQDQPKRLSRQQDLAIPAPRPARGAGQCTTRPHPAGGAARGPGLQLAPGEGCGEYDCGACTVVLGEARTATSALPRCQQLHPPGPFGLTAHGLWTVEDLADPTDPSERPIRPAAQTRQTHHPTPDVPKPWCSATALNAAFAPRLCDEPVWHVPEPVCQGQPCHRARAQRWRTFRKPVPLHRATAPSWTPPSKWPSCPHGGQRSRIATKLRQLLSAFPTSAGANSAYKHPPI